MSSRGFVVFSSSLRRDSQALAFGTIHGQRSGSPISPLPSRNPIPWDSMLLTAYVVNADFFSVKKFFLQIVKYS